MLRQHSMGSAGKSSDYVETAFRDRYGTGKHASGAGARDPDSVTRGPLKKASYVEEIEIERMGGSRPPVQSQSFEKVRKVYTQDGWTALTGTMKPICRAGICRGLIII